MTDFTGEFAALGTAILFALGSTLFTLSGRQLGSPLVNRTRLLIAFVVLAGVHWLSFGEPLPSDAHSSAVFWLGLSGFVGLALGDASLFQAFVMIGPRLSMLVMALAPVLGAILAWLFLGEALNAQEIGGIVLAVVGVAIVVTERQGKQKTANTPDSTRTYMIGLLFAFGGALGQAGGQVLAKFGLANDFSPLSGTLIRMTVAMLVIWVFAIGQRQVRNGFQRLRANPRATAMVTVAAITGPVIGVWLSLVAVQRTSVGVSSALIALTPVFLLPISFFVFHERISAQAIFGTLVAFGGTVLLFV